MKTKNLNVALQNTCSLASLAFDVTADAPLSTFKTKRPNSKKISPAIKGFLPYKGRTRTSTYEWQREFHQNRSTSKQADNKTHELDLHGDLYRRHTALLMLLK